MSVHTVPVSSSLDYANYFRQSERLYHGSNGFEKLLHWHFEKYTIYEHGNEKNLLHDKKHAVLLVVKEPKFDPNGGVSHAGNSDLTYSNPPQFRRTSPLYLSVARVLRSSKKLRHKFGEGYSPLPFRREGFGVEQLFCDGIGGGGVYCTI